MGVTRITPITNACHPQRQHQLNQHQKQKFCQLQTRTIHQTPHHRGTARRQCSHPAPKQTHLPTSLTTITSLPTLRPGTMISIHHHRSTIQVMPRLRLKPTIGSSWRRGSMRRWKYAGSARMRSRTSLMSYFKSILPHAAGNFASATSLQRKCSRG